MLYTDISAFFGGVLYVKYGSLDYWDSADEEYQYFSHHYFGFICEVTNNHHVANSPQIAKFIEIESNSLPCNKKLDPPINLTKFQNRQQISTKLTYPLIYIYYT
jgi:hypothetical protein